MKKSNMGKHSHRAIRRASRSMVIIPILFSLSAPTTAQIRNRTSGFAAPIAQVEAQTSVYLPSGTTVVVRMNDTLTTKGGRAQVGDKFYLTVVYDVISNNMVVIPKGSPAIGEVTWRTGKAVFGKSGKMEIELKRVDVGGIMVPLAGKFRQNGEGNTVAVVGATVLTLALGAGLFITGKSAIIPAGREFEAVTTEGVNLPSPTGRAE